MISREDIEHLKDLARVEFGEEETKKLAKDLGAILGYAEELKEVDVSKVQEITHSIDLKNVFRKDEATHYNSELTRELIDLFPEKFDPAGGTKGAYLKVKPIF